MDCPKIPEIKYRDFSSKLHSIMDSKRILISACIELTYRCNNNCAHCFCNLPASDMGAEQRELNTEEIKSILDELTSMGCLWLLITGGEPLLRKDFEEIYLYAKKKGFLITLFTNGTMLNKKIIEFLAEYPPFVTEISLYGATKETYEKVTRVKGSYERCMAGINSLAASNIKLKLKTMAISTNQHEIKAMDNIAQDLGCEFRFDSIVQKRMDNNKYIEPEKYRISARDAIDLDKMFPKRMIEFSEFCEKFIGKPINTNKLYQCGAGINNIHITPYGYAMACSIMVKDQFLLKRKGLKWIWEEGIQAVIGKEKHFYLPCDDCSLISLCGQCPAWSIIESGNIKKEVTYLCQIAKIRKNELDNFKRRSNEKSMVETRT